MNPVLLYTDTERIEDEQATLANVVTLYQSIYNAVKAAGVTAPTIAEIDSLVQAARKQSVGNEDAIFKLNSLANLAPDFVTNYVKNKLVKQISPFVVNGVTLTDVAVAGMISMPDVSGITEALQPVWGGNSQDVFIGNAKGAELTLLTLAANVISAVNGADATLASKYTYYTKSDASASIANSLQTVADALNTFDAANGGFFSDKIPPSDERWNAPGQHSTAIPGLQLAADGSFVVSIDFIRKFEQRGTLNFIPNRSY